MNKNYPPSYCPIGLQREKEKPKTRETSNAGNFWPREQGMGK